MTLNNKNIAKSVSFCSPLESTCAETPTQSCGAKKLRPTLKTPTLSNTIPNQAEIMPLTTVAACEIISLKKAFSHSFDTIGNMPINYTVCTNPVTWLNSKSHQPSHLTNQVGILHHQPLEAQLHPMHMP